MEYLEDFRERKPLTADFRLKWVEYIPRNPDYVRCKVCKARLKMSKKWRLLQHSESLQHKHALRIQNAYEKMRDVHLRQVEKIQQIPPQSRFRESLQRYREDQDEIDYLSRRKLQLEAELDQILEYKTKLEAMVLEQRHDLPISEHTDSLIN